MDKRLLIGFVGQGFIGKNYADDFVSRGFEVVRYSLEPEHAANKDRIASCDIVFIAVPTPTTPRGFDDSIVQQALALVGAGRSAVIKSTIIPGTCAKMQDLFPDRFVFHSPEFLTEKNAAYDAAHPTRNIIGAPRLNDEYQRRAQEVLSVLPPSPLDMIVTAADAELVKYAANGFLFLKLIYANIFYDLAAATGADWEKIKAGLAADPRIGPSHLNPIQASDEKGVSGRGAGGHCFIKDFAALTDFVRAREHDPDGAAFLGAAEKKNIALLEESGKDRDILMSVYGGDNKRL